MWTKLNVYNNKSPSTEPDDDYNFDTARRTEIPPDIFVIPREPKPPDILTLA